jgi:hypothetical protein
MALAGAMFARPVTGFSRPDESDRFTWPKLSLEHSGAPQLSNACIAAVGFFGIPDVVEDSRVLRERKRRVADLEAERRQRARRGRDLVQTSRRAAGISVRNLRVDSAPVFSEIDGRLQLQQNGFVAANEPVSNDDGVLEVRQEDAALDLRLTTTKAPDRQPKFEVEVDQLQLLRGEALKQVTPHHHPANRRVQGGDEQAVIAARVWSVDDARGVAADAVRDEPFARN